MGNHPSLAEIYRRQVADLEKLVSGPAADPAAVDLIRSLIQQIVSTPDGDQLRIDLKGDLAAILSIAANAKPAGRTPGGLEQIKLVAGAGFGLYRISVKR